MRLKIVKCYESGILKLAEVSFILGISAFYHDAAACLLKDGKVVAAAHEERFTRKKHDAGFPTHAIAFCLSTQQLNISDIDLVVFYEKPFLKFDRLIDTYAQKSPLGFKSFRKAMKSWISEKLWIPNIIKKELKYNGEILFSEHHEAHAASAFFSSPFKEAAILIMDGVGERTSITIAKGIGNKIQLIKEQHFPHSLGLFYSALTYYCGFKVNSGEYKLMGLAPYGKPIYKELIYKHFISIDEKGVITLNMKHFAFDVGLRMTNKQFERVLGKLRRKPESAIDQFYKDVARSGQAVLEEIILKLGALVKQETQMRHLCLAGGVALNCKANQCLEETGLYDAIWVQPASGDSGGALGAAFIGAYHHKGYKRQLLEDKPENHIYLGNSFSQKEIIHALNNFGIHFETLNDGDLIDQVAEILDKKAIVGWFQGAMEFGPRALGSRSILASPKFKDMQSHVNLKIKMREAFRPFAPMVLEEKAKDWFVMHSHSKYMLFTYKAKKAESIPSCVHVDNTARVQTVGREDNPLVYSLLEVFEKRSGIPILINTSFNVRGEPIVCTIEDAVRCFFLTEMDYLAIGNCLVSKTKNPDFDTSQLKKVSYVVD